MKVDLLKGISAISFIFIFVGIFLLSFGLFWNLFLTFLGVFFLIFGGIGILIARKIVSTIKRANPEAFGTPIDESGKRREKEKTADFKNMPKWAIVLLAVMVLIGIMGTSGVFSFNPFVEDFLLILVIVLLLICYFVYRRKVKQPFPI